MSVRLSVTLVHCIQMANDIVTLLSQPSSPIILVFYPYRRYPIPRGTPSAGAQNTRGWENFAIKKSPAGTALPSRWCFSFLVYLFITLLSGGALFVQGRHTLNKYGSVLMQFSPFFGKDCPIRWARDCPFSSTGDTTIFTKLWSNIAKTPKVGGNICEHHFL